MPKTYLEEQEEQQTYSRTIAKPRAPVYIDNGPCPCGWGPGMSISWRCGGPRCKPIPRPPDTAENAALAAAQAAYVPRLDETAVVVPQQARGPLGGDSAQARAAVVAHASAQAALESSAVTAASIYDSVLRDIAARQATEQAQSKSQAANVAIADGIKSDLQPDDLNDPLFRVEHVPVESSTSQRFALIELE